MDARTILHQCPLFADLSEEAIEALARHARLVEVPSGGLLFARGSAPDHIYIVATGRLRAMLPDGGVAGMIPRLEPTGEISAILNEPRNSDVYAIRDSVVVQLPVDEMIATVQHFPEAMLRLTRIIAQRLRRNAHRQALASARTGGSLAIVPATRSVPARAIAEALCKALAVHTEPELLDAETVDAALGPGATAVSLHDGVGNARMVEYLNALETLLTHIVYLANPDADPWARRCMAQADRILLVVDARDTPEDSPMIDVIKRSGVRAPIDLIVVRPEGTDAGSVFAWRERSGASSHFFVRPDVEADFTSLARQLSARGIGIVLGGGGARGFAHIGLLRALHELKMPVDIVGGSSMGAFLSGLLACGHDFDSLRCVARETFVTHNYLNDYVLPSVSLIRGRKFVRRLHDIFGEQQIEDLRLPYFCVSTNLTRGRAMVHDRGPLYMWTAASMAVPGVAPPVVYNGELFADGAVINSLPTDIMQALERGPIIASDVSTEGGIAAPGIAGPDPEGLLRLKTEDAPRLFSILFRTATLTSESGTARRAALADCYLRMPVSRIGMFDWKRMDEIIDRGYEFALQQLTPIRDRLMR